MMKFLKAMILLTELQKPLFKYGRLNLEAPLLMQQETFMLFFFKKKNAFQKEIDKWIKKETKKKFNCTTGVI